MIHIAESSIIKLFMYRSTICNYIYIFEKMESYTVTAVTRASSERKDVISTVLSLLAVNKTAAVKQSPAAGTMLIKRCVCMKRRSVSLQNNFFFASSQVCNIY